MGIMLPHLTLRIIKLRQQVIGMFLFEEFKIRLLTNRQPSPLSPISLRALTVPVSKVNVGKSNTLR